MGLARNPPGYQLGFPLGSGGMATVRYGRRVAAGGFAHAVAIKELHPHLSENPAAVAMFLDEARLAARVVHANVVSVLDVVSQDDRVWAVMPYVEGESLCRLISRADERGARVPIRIAIALALDVLAGLSAAHRATDERGGSLGIVHRDVSPQNVMVGADGVGRVLDFGVAKAHGRLQETRDGQIKGKLAYMAPEHLGGDASPSTDVYAAAIILWEMLAGRRLFEGGSDLDLMVRVLHGATSPPSAHAPVPAAVDAVVESALALDPSRRFASASAMASALSTAAAGAIASRAEIAAWVEELSADTLAERKRLAAAMADVAAPGDETPPERVQRADLVTSTLGISTLVMAPRAARAPARQRSPWKLVAAAVAASIAVAGASATAARRLPPPVAASVNDSHVVQAAIARSRAAALAAQALSATESPGEGATSPAIAAVPAGVVVASPRAGRSSLTVPKGRASKASHELVTAEVAPSAPPVASAARADERCDPPFVVDERGVRQYKRSCIR